MSLPVSIIVPAHNAATTLAETLASVQAQTHRNWELIVVENGSTDSTALLAEQFAAHDPRIRAVRNTARGVSRARNRGLELARHDWVLFLDADDWLLPGHLEALTAVLAADSTIDAVHCGWRRISPEGVVMFEEHGPDLPDLFPLLGRTCVFAIHACIVRKSLVIEVGGFDPALRTCEDWDLWQRLARGGARFALRREILSAYRARPQSASMDGRQMLADGFDVIGRAYVADPRVPHPLPKYADGLPLDGLAAARLENLIWQAGLMLGAGLEATSLLDAVAHDPLTRLQPEAAAAALFEATLLPTARAPAAWWRLLAWIAPQLERFLAALERHTQQPGLAHSLQVDLERRAVRPRSVTLPVTLGRTRAITVEVTTRFPDLTLPSPIERLYCRVEIEGRFLGELELPVIDGFVPAEVLADAVAAEFAWPILGQFFGRTLYPGLQVETDANGWTVRRDGALLAQGLPGEKAVAWEQAHDRIGWSVFMQEAWGLDGLPDGRFYTLQKADRCSRPRPGARAEVEWLVCELLDSLKDHRLSQPHVDVVLTVAGSPVGAAALIVPKRLLLAQTIRAALTLESGFELCRVCVREALLQRPLDAGGSLRARLEAARERRLRVSAGAALPAEAGFMPGSETTFPAAAHSIPEIAVWPRRSDAPCGTSASRRALLPRGAATELKRLVTAGGELLVSATGSAHVGGTVLYAPDVVWRPRADRRRAPLALPTAVGRIAGDTAVPTRVDESAGRALDLLESRRFRQGLELGCGAGALSAQLAVRVAHLVSADASADAVDQARRRHAGVAKIEFHQIDPIYDPLPRRTFDLIVFRDDPERATSSAALEVIAEKLALALAPGGCFLWIQGPDAASAESSEAKATEPASLPATEELDLVQELRDGTLHARLYRRRAPWQCWLARTVPGFRRFAEGSAVRRAEVRRKDQSPLVAAAEKATSRLPILMYHRIARSGPAALARYCLAPDRFESQLRYLREQGYQSVTLEEWRQVREFKRTLPGKRVLLTFDDACTDFAEFAWPLLKRYGFNAVLFAPTDHVGGSCRWDAGYGDPAPILDWSSLQALRAVGVEIGSHTASHPLLTGLSPEEIAREALRSRAVLEEKLGHAVTSIAYPFGASDRVVESVFGACGYVFGLTCDHRCCEISDRLLAMPRIEVSSLDEPAHFERLLGL